MQANAGNDAARERVIMFDFDGVVADSFEIFYEHFAEAVVALGYAQFSSREALLKLFEGNMIKELIKAGFPFYKLKKFSKQFSPRIKEANLRVQPFSGMPELLAELAAAFPVYVITSNVSEAILAFLERYQIAGILEVLGSDKEVSKVKKIRQVLQRHPGADAWYIGDTKGDMIEGRTAGVQTVGVAWGWHAKELLLEASPDYVAHTPAELRALLITT